MGKRARKKILNCGDGFERKEGSLFIHSLFRGQTSYESLTEAVDRLKRWMAGVSNGKGDLSEG